MRQTSLITYQKLVDSGMLGPRRLEVWRALAEHGPMTGRELDKLLNNPSAHKRPSELCKMGVAKEKRRRICMVTGQEAIEWECTDDTPVPLKQRGTALKRPSVASMARALSEIRAVFHGHGEQQSDDVVAMLLWIDRKLIRVKP